jgi:CspA family cold shock protein
MAEGTIKKLTDRGFGFIRTDSGQEIFFHAQNLEGVSFEELREGQPVTFEEGRSDKGPRAEHVTIAE